MNLNAFNLGMPFKWLPPKILLIMKLIIVLMISFLMQVSAAGYGQKINIDKNNTSLKEVLENIKKQTGYVFFSKDYDLKQAKISVKLKDADIDEALEACLKGLPLSYKIVDKTVFVQLKEKTFLERVVATLNSIDASGRVVDSENRPLPGASVKVKKTGKGVSTDKDGRFFLRGVEEGAVLVVSFIGYLPKEVNASANMGNVVLELSLSKLDEVQVVAYGTTTQRLSTGNVTTIKADVIEKQPVNNPLLALQGRVPGLFIEQATGFAGTGVKVRIQGTNSLANGNDPLYVVDGIPFTSQLISIKGASNSDLNFMLGSSGNGNYSSPLNFINPADIESIDVLKDADATAIYGSRAANGAILITTKKGKVGDVKINLNAQGGLGEVSRKLDLMTSKQYLDMRAEAMRNDGITKLKTNDYDLNGIWDNTRYTDWQKELIGESAHYRDIQASVSGGSNFTTFLAGLGYHSEGNVFPGDFKDVKTSAHFSINGSSDNQKFKFQLSGSYLDDDNRLPQVDLTKSAMSLAPVAPNLYNSDGTVNWQPNPTGNSTFFANPVSYLFQTSKNKTNNLIANALLSYEIIEGLALKSSFGYNRINTDLVFTSPPLLPENVAAGFRSSIFGKSSLSSWLIEPQLTYHRTVGPGRLEILVGSTFQKEKRDASSILAEGFNTDQVMEDIKAATSLTVGSTSNSLYKYNAIFGRINYNLNDTYIINFTARRDGSSRFGSENRFNNFGAVGAAWVFSNEKLVKNQLKTLSFGKLRISYGTTGSDQIGDYNFMSLYSVIDGISAPYQGALGYSPNNLTNPYLQWEETKKLQLGLDLGFFNDRVFLIANYLLNRSSNQLLNYTLPINTGFGTIATNLPATIQNSGWELSLSTTNVNKQGFKWSSSFNLTLPKNKLVKFANLQQSSYGSFYQIGESMNRVQLFHFLGVDPTTGRYQFQDLNGNPTLTPQSGTDDYIFVNTDPKFYGGLQNTFSYKGLQLDILFQFTKQIGKNYWFGDGGSSIAGRFVNGTVNKPQWHLDRWQKSGDIARIEKYTTGLGLLSSLTNALNSDASWSDASYIRLKNVSLSWQIPSKLTKKVRIQNCKFYLQGQNLLTITNYLGLDPESKSSITLPPLRVISMGIQIGL